MTKIFISYQREDEYKAREVRERVIQNGFEPYIDCIDDADMEDGPKLAGRLLNVLARCDQLLAVVGIHTHNSWWVPWEIGVACDRHYFLATYMIHPVKLPSYLASWPVLRSLGDVDLYCEESVFLNKSTLGLDPAGRKSTASLFHNGLMLRLRQARGS